MDEDDLNDETFGGDDGGLPDFFGGGGAGVARPADDDDDDEMLNSLTFGGGFEVPLSGLPEFFSMVGGEPPAEAAVAEHDDLAAITGAPTSEWSASAAKFADIQAQFMRDWQHKRTAAAQSAAGQLGGEVPLASLMSLGLEDEGAYQPAAAPAASGAGRAGDAVARGPTAPGKRAPPGLAQTAAAHASPSPVIITAQELEAQMMASFEGLSAAHVPSPASRSGGAAPYKVPSGLVPVLYDAYSQQVPFPRGWKDGDAPPDGHFIAYESPAQPPAAAARAVVVVPPPVAALAAPAPPAPAPAQQGPALFQPTQAALPAPAPPHLQQQQQQGMLQQLPPTHQQQHQHQLTQQAGAGHPYPAAPPQQQQLNPLPPVAVANLQMVIQRVMILGAQTPGGVNSLPPEVRSKAVEAQQLLQMHFSAVAEAQRRFMAQHAAMQRGAVGQGAVGAPQGGLQAPPLPGYAPGPGGPPRGWVPPQPAGPPMPQLSGSPMPAAPSAAAPSAAAPPLPSQPPRVVVQVQQQQPAPHAPVVVLKSSPPGPPSTGTPAASPPGVSAPRGWAKLAAPQTESPSGPPPLPPHSPQLERGTESALRSRVSSGGPELLLDGPTPAEAGGLAPPSSALKVKGPRAPVVVGAPQNQSARLAAGPSEVAAGFFGAPLPGSPPLPRGPRPSNSPPPLPLGPPSRSSRRPITTTLRSDAYAQFMRSAVLAAATYRRSGGNAAGAGTTMASLLSKTIPPYAGGRLMHHHEVHLVARFMYNNISNTADPFSECYYLFALRAKAAAQAARAMFLAAEAVSAAAASGGGAAEPQPTVAAATSAPGNVLDAAAVLSSLGASAMAKRAVDAGARGAAPRAAESEPARPAAAASVDETAAEAAAGVISSLPLATVFSRNVAANLADLRRIAATKRRQWETHHQVLGRQQSASVRKPKTVLNLSESGVTSADDMDRDAAGGLSVTDGAPATEALPESASTLNSDATWLARARIDDVLQLVLQLQEAARKLQANLRTVPPPPADLTQQMRHEVLRLREELASALGLRRPLGGGTPELEQPPAVSAAPARWGVDDDVTLLLLALPKGKRLIARAVPMLMPVDRVTAVTAAMRHLPHVVASAVVGQDAEDADAALAAFIARLVKSVVAPLPAAGGAPESGAEAGMAASLAMLHTWLEELHTSHSGAIVRALLQHPAASEVISNLLFRGEHEAAAAEAAPGLAEGVARWRTTTEALGRAFVEAS